jgi:hypothetical protein
MFPRVEFQAKLGYRGQSLFGVVRAVRGTDDVQMSQDVVEGDGEFAEGDEGKVVCDFEGRQRDIPVTVMDITRTTVA